MKKIRSLGVFPFLSFILGVTVNAAAGMTVNAEVSFRCGPMRAIPYVCKLVYESVSRWCVTLPEAGVYCVRGAVYVL